MASLHQVRPTVRRAEIISKVTVPKGLTVENGTYRTASGSSRTNALQATIAFSTIAIRMARSSMVVTPIQPRKPRSRRRGPRLQGRSPRSSPPPVSQLRAIQLYLLRLQPQFQRRRWNSKASATSKSSEVWCIECAIWCSIHIQAARAVEPGSYEDLQLSREISVLHEYEMVSATSRDK